MAAAPEGINDPIEAAAFRYLTARFSEVSHEPFGSITFPDFIVDGSILFEVTRLEAKVTKDGKTVPHSNFFIPLVHSIERVIGPNGFPITGGHDYFLCLRLKYPVEQRAVQRPLNQFLDRVAAGPSEFLGRTVKLVDNLSCEVVQGSPSTDPKMYTGSAMPRDLPGWIIQDTVEQVEDALERKTPKLRNFLSSQRADIRQAWLIGGGGASEGFRGENAQYIRETLKRDGDWAGIILLNMDRPEKSIEIRANTLP